MGTNPPILSTKGTDPPMDTQKKIKGTNPPMKKPLMPCRHKQRELFSCDLPDGVIKDDMASMEHPIFSLSKKPDLNIRYYKHNGNSLEIAPSVKGMATIYDKDILIYATSVLMSKKKRGETINRLVEINAKDLLIFTNRNIGGKDYESLKQAFFRLRGTTIQTNIKTNGVEESETFGLVDSATVKKCDQSGKAIEWSIRLSRWLFKAIEANEVLTLHQDYFRLRKPLERRVYELGRKHCGTKDEWKINLELLKKKSGSLSPLKRFRYLIKDIIKNDHLPDYHLNMDDRDNVIFTRKQHSKVGELSTSQNTPSSIHYTVDSLDQYLDSKAQEKCPKLARERGIDYYYIKNEFCNFLNSKGAPDNISACFIGFIKQKKIS